jgi:ubiquinone/menaquinone biosynthesis C-methylase UbiE
LSIYRSKISVFNYDSIPEGYYYNVMKSGSPIQRFWHEKRFQEIIDRIEDGLKVLDFGCGPGTFLSLLGGLRSNVTATGVDIGSKQIEFARKLIHKQALNDRIQFSIIEEAFKELPFEDKSFDIIASIEVVEHIHPFFAHRVLAEAKRVLKPKGRLLITTPNYRSHWPLIELLLNRLSPVKYHEQHISKFTPQAFVKFIESAGFEIKTINTIFVVAPFLTPLSFRLAELFHQSERKMEPLIGALLVVEAVPYIY